MARLLYFGVVGDKAGRREETLALPAEVRTGADLRGFLIARTPALAEPLTDGRVRLAVNQEIAPWEAELGDGDEIAFLPPMSGG
ncbi:MAG: molybdopterin converting factor subunit 1 [Caulobacterales bacterium]|nr:molybdopterin converting factor subunit 1 [Caulobacterales bacterium]